MNLFLRISIVLTILALAGCSSVPTPPAPPQQEITAEPPVDEARQQQIKEALVQITSQYPDMRINAVAALIELDTQEAIPQVTKLLQDTGSGIRQLAVYALGELDAKEAIPDITKLLQDNNSFVRWSAVEALMKLDAKEAIPDITKLLQDTDQNVRQYAQDVLKALGAEVPEEKK